MVGILLTMRSWHEQGWRRPIWVVALLVCLSIPASAEQIVQRRTSASDPGGKRDRIKTIGARRRDLEALRAERARPAFVSSKGVTIHTNRPEKWSGRPGYTKIDLGLKPISVDTRYRGRSSGSEFKDTEVAGLIRQYAALYGLEENLIYAVIKVESDFDWDAVSSKGASGYMQLMPGTAKDMGVRNILNPAENIAGGTQYLAKLLRLFDNDLSLALAGYNAGPQNVKKHNGIPPFKETQRYVKDVLAYSRFYANKGTRPTTLTKSRRNSIFRYPPPGSRSPKAPKHVIYFQSGLCQLVDKVVTEKDYYFVQCDQRTFKIPKHLVKKIEAPA